MKKVLLFIILLIPSILWAKQTPHDAFLYTATPCFGNTCAAYDIMLFSDGEMVFIGKKNVEYEGVFKFSVGKKVFEKVVALSKKYKMKEFKDAYGVRDESMCGKVWSDNPSSLMSLRLAGDEKTIRYYHGCKGFERENELIEFEKNLKEELNVFFYITGKAKPDKAKKK